MRNHRLIQLFFIILLVCSNNASANIYQFSVGGWSDGGHLSGQFSTSFGAEIDSNITTSEIQSFQANYVGTYNINWSLSDIVYFGFGQTINSDFLLGIDSGNGGGYIGSPSSFSFNRYVAGINNNEFAGTNELMVIQEIADVPLPPSFILMLMGLLGLSGFVSRSKST